MGSGMSVMITSNRGIEAWIMLSWYHKLKMEVSHPNGPKWRVSPMKACKSIMEQNGYPCPHRTKAKVLDCYIIFLKDVKGLDPT
jgi:hypothetical protein